MVHCMAHWGSRTGGYGFVGVPFWRRICTCMNVHIQFTNPAPLFSPFLPLPPSIFLLLCSLPPPPSLLSPSLPSSSLPPFLLFSFSYAVRMGHRLIYMRTLQNHHLSYFLLVVQPLLLSPTVVIALHNCPSHALAQLQMTAPPFLLPLTLVPHLLGLITWGQVLVPRPVPQGLLSVLPLPQLLGGRGSPLVSLMRRLLTSNKALAHDQSLRG